MKKITSLTLGLSFLTMTYTGVILFFCPHGRVAYWNHWTFLGLTKTQYGELHTTSMLLMLIFGVLHIYYNWKPLVSYLRNKSHILTFTTKEFLIALVINIIFIVGTIGMVHPFKFFLNFEENFKESWSNNYPEPPYGHAELSSLKGLCDKMNIDFTTAQAALQQHNIKFKVTDELLTIAQKNGLRPADIFAIIQPPHVTPDIKVPAQLGQKTLEQLARRGKINLAASIEKLKALGLNDIHKESRMKNLAFQLQITPKELYLKLKQ